MEVVVSEKHPVNFYLKLTLKASALLFICFICIYIFIDSYNAYRHVEGKYYLLSLVADSEFLLLYKMPAHQDLYKLLSSPGNEIHCSALMGTAVLENDEYTVFDEKAKRSYKEKILNLQEEISFAEGNNNYKRNTTLHWESVDDWNLTF